MFISSIIIFNICICFKLYDNDRKLNSISEISMIVFFIKDVLYYMWYVDFNTCSTKLTDEILKVSQQFEVGFCKIIQYYLNKMSRFARRVACEIILRI